MPSLTTIIPLLLVLAGRAFADELAPSTNETEPTTLWTGLAQTCKDSIAALVDEKAAFAKCSGSASLFTDLVSNAALDADASLTPFIKNWLTKDLCGSSGCTDSVVNAVYQNVTKACGTDTSEANLIPYAVQGGLLNYQSLRTALCLKAGNTTGDFCPVQILSNIESSGVPLSRTEVENALAEEDPEVCVDEVPDAAYCTDCGKAMFSEVLPGLKLLSPDWAQTATDTFSDLCGADFVDGKTPSGVVDGTTPTTTTTSSGSQETGSNGSGSGASHGSGTNSDDSAAKLRYQSSSGPLFLLGVAALFTMGA